MSTTQAGPSEQVTGRVFVGATRFSVYSPKTVADPRRGAGFRNEEEYRDYLFSESRLSQRAHVFLEMSLPQIEIGARGHHVRHVVHYSPELPQKYRDALEAAGERYPFLVLNEVREGNPRIRPAELGARLAQEVGAQDGVFGTYTIDDDNVLATSYFDQVAPYLTREHAGWIVSMAAGVAALYVDGGFYLVRRDRQPKTSIGLLDVCRVDGDRIVVPAPIQGHGRADEANPVILDSRRTAYLHGFGDSQDTWLRASRKAGQSPLDKAREEVMIMPRLEEDEVLADNFPVLEGMLHEKLDPSDEGQTLLTEPVELGDEDTTYPLDDLSGRVTTIVALDGRVSDSRAVTLVYDLVGEDGEALDGKQWGVRLRDAGLLWSPSVGTGFYRLVRSTRGTRDDFFVVGLPDGVRCRAVTVRRTASARHVPLRLVRLAVFPAPASDADR